MSNFKIHYFYCLAAVTLLFAAPTISAAVAKKWTTYRSNILGLMISVPSDWSPVKSRRALAFRYDDQAGGTAAIGFLKSSESTSIEAQSAKEFAREGKRSGWTRSPANIAGMPAIKMIGTPSKNPSQRVIHYFVQAPTGVYLIQCQATADRWPDFQNVFSSILVHLKFLPAAAG